MALIDGMLFVIVLILSTWFMRATESCKQRYTGEPLNGFYCNGQNYTPPQGVTQVSCEHACVTSPSCSAMSYNPVTSTCLLAAQPCVKAEKHEDFTLMIFRELEYGYVINMVLYPTVCSLAQMMLMLVGFLLGTTFSLVKLTHQDKIGKHVLLKMGTRLATLTKTCLQSIRIAQWLGYLTKLVTFFPQKPLWRGCWLLAVVSTALALGMQLVIGGLVTMLKGTSQPTMPLVVVTLPLSLIFLFLCNGEILVWYKCNFDSVYQMARAEQIP